MVSAVTALLAVLTIATASLGVLVAGRAQAATAADAAALAAAVATYPGAGHADPRAAAALAAAGNGAVLERCDCPVQPGLSTRVVTVTVAVEVAVPLFGVLETRQAARAEFDPSAWLGR
jgi:hypothetical protein